MRAATAAALLGLLVAACTTRLGEPCRQHSDCRGERSYCARAEVCTRDCGDGGACPAEAACVDVGPRAVCLERCTGDRDCLEGFTCAATEPRVCLLADPLANPD